MDKKMEKKPQGKQSNDKTSQRNDDEIDVNRNIHIHSLSGNQDQVQTEKPFNHEMPNCLCLNQANSSTNKYRCFIRLIQKIFKHLNIKLQKISQQQIQMMKYRLEKRQEKLDNKFKQSDITDKNLKNLTFKRNISKAFIILIIILQNKENNQKLREFMGKNEENGLKGLESEQIKRYKLGKANELQYSIIQQSVEQYIRGQIKQLQLLFKFLKPSIINNHRLGFINLEIQMEAQQQVQKQNQKSEFILINGPNSQIDAYKQQYQQKKRLSILQPQDQYASGQKMGIKAHKKIKKNQLKRLKQKQKKSVQQQQKQIQSQQKFLSKKSKKRRMISKQQKPHEQMYYSNGNIKQNINRCQNKQLNQRSFNINQIKKDIQKQKQLQKNSQYSNQVLQDSPIQNQLQSYLSGQQVQVNGNAFSINANKKEISTQFQSSSSSEMPLDQNSNSNNEFFFFFEHQNLYWCDNCQQYESINQHWSKSDTNLNNQSKSQQQMQQQNLNQQSKQQQMQQQISKKQQMQQQISQISPQQQLIINMIIKEQQPQFKLNQQQKINYF